MTPEPIVTVTYCTFLEATSGHHVGQKRLKSRAGAQEAAPCANQGGEKAKGGGEEEERGKEKSE